MDTPTNQVVVYHVANGYVVAPPAAALKGQPIGELTFIAEKPNDLQFAIVQCLAAQRRDDSQLELNLSTY